METIRATGIRVSEVKYTTVEAARCGKADILEHSNIGTTRIYLLSTGAEHAEQLDRLNLVCRQLPTTEYYRSPICAK